MSTPQKTNWSADAAAECFDIIGKDKWTFESDEASIERFQEIIERHSAQQAVNERCALLERVKELEGALAELYHDEKLDDDDPRLAATRNKVYALLYHPHLLASPPARPATQPDKT